MEEKTVPFLSLTTITEIPLYGEAFIKNTVDR